MPNRIIRESILTSPNFNRLSAEADQHFYRLLLISDDFGCFEATAQVVKGHCYPLKNDVTVKDILLWHQELQDNNIAAFWEDRDRLYGIFLTFAKHNRQRAKHHRRTPEPPVEVADKCQQVLSSDNKHPPMPANDVYKPKPKPKPKHNLEHKPKPADKCQRMTAVSSQGEENNFQVLEDWQRVRECYETNIAQLTPRVDDLIKATLSEGMGPDWVVDAIYEAVKQNHRSWAYIEAILRRWREEGRSPPKAKAVDKKRKEVSSDREREEVLNGWHVIESGPGQEDMPEVPGGV